MDEYSPKRHDIAQLKFLCETCIMTVLQTLKKAIMAGLTANLGDQPPVE